MAIKNAYPNLPVIDCKVHSVPMEDINNYIKTIPYIAEVKRIVYIIIRNETANGKSFLNNNGCGQQADGGKLPLKWISYITATFVKKENMTGKERRFVAFDKWQTTINLLADRVFNRGLYIGENIDSNYYKGTVKTPQDAAIAYWQEWVVGTQTQPSKQFVNDFVSMYNQSTKIFQ
jgi:hypothetical protein